MQEKKLTNAHFDFLADEDYNHSKFILAVASKMLMQQRKPSSVTEIEALLREHDINPTSQRIEIAQLLFSRCEHLSAEEVFSHVNGAVARVSKATVYNTLGLFAERGLIREVIADPERVFYDPNTAPHHHFYDTTTGKLMDIPAEEVHISALPVLPDGMRMEGVEVIVRVRPATS